MGTKNAQTPPAELHDRPVGVAPTVVNTVEVPCDPRDPDHARWFDSGSSRPLRNGNDVTTLVDGDETFALMANEIEKAKTTDHYIYLLNWWIDLNIDLRPATPPTGGAASTKLWDLLENAVKLGVQVRGMFWDQAGSQNDAEVERMNKMASTANGSSAAILDNNTLNYGCHHQKILTVKGADGVVAFCGGVDFNSDRISHVARQPGSPMHDVHCKIAGPAAWDLRQIFVDRWNDHPDSVGLDKAKGALRGTTEAVPTGTGEQYVQIGRTFGNGSAHAGIKNRFGNAQYSFAPQGEQTCRAIIFHAIEQAKEFIYVQDQYLQSMEASNKLLAQLPKIKKLVILIPHPVLNDHPAIWTYQKAFVDNFGGNAKVSVCYLKEAGAAADPKTVAATTQRTYVHSKIWIMDDKFMVIGSANCNNRGYTHDSEVVAGIYDESKDKPCTLHMAHALRIRLWAQHLNLKAADVFDPIGSAAHWASPTVASRIARFDQNAGTDSMWSKQIPYAEPIGS